MAHSGRIVLIVVSSLQTSGPIRVVVNMLKHLDRSSWQPIVLTLSPESPSKASLSEQIVEALNIKVASLKLSRYAFPIYGASRFRRAVAELNATIVHTHGIRSDSVSLTLPPHIPRVTTVHNIPWEDYPERYSGLGGAAIANLHCHILQRIPTVVACSHTVAKALMSRNIPTTTVANGVDQDIFRPANRIQKLLTRKQLRLPPSATIFISTGHLSRLKDPLTVAEGFLQARLGREAVLVFLGNGPYLAELQTVANASNTVIVRGRVGNVHEYLQAADYYISGSHSEGLPNAVMEALSTGLPAILSDIGPHRELVSEMGHVGIFFAAGDRTQLSAAIRTLANRSQPIQPSDIASAITGRYDAKTMARSYEQVYQAMVPH